MANKSGEKPSALQRAIEQARAPGALARLLDPRNVLFLGACLAFVAGAFCAWQAWMMWSRISGTYQVDSVSRAEVVALNQFVADTRLRVIHEINSDAVATALATGDEAGEAAAVTVLKKGIPDLVAADFYRADLSDVLGTDFAKFGYAKAAMLVQAHQSQIGAPLQSHLVAAKQRVLAFALPVTHDKQTLAYAYLELPFEPLLKIFHEQSVSNARIDLRQGEGRGDLIIASIGNAAVRDSLTDPGIGVGGSLFRIGSSLEEFDILLPDNLWLAIPLTLILFGLGVFLLQARNIGLREALDRFLRRQATAPAAAEQTLAQAIAKPAPTVKPRPAPAATQAEVAVDRSIFRAYDIRGVLGKTLTVGVARQIGRAIGSEAQQRGLKEIVVGRDGRLSGPELSAALIEGLRATGCNVIDIGAVPTPVLYFATYHLNAGSGVMVTGSHNPPDYNGFKIVLGGETLAEQAIADLYTRISENRLASGSGGLQTMDVTADYTDRITSDVLIERKLKVVVDCGNGIPGAVAPAVLEGIGCEVLPLYCDVDGNFPNHHPDPSDPHNLQDLILSVKQMQADVGLAFDGDGDRLGVVTANGEIIFPDRTLMLFARDVLTRNPGATIIYDVKCTGKLQSWILQAGGSPIMWKTGHSLIKSKMRETEAELAGEMSGHFFFRERWYGFDDGIYAAARLMEILAADPEGRAPQEIFDSLPKGVSTPELKIEMAEGEHYRFIEKFRETSNFEGARVTTIDGVRADWPDGWGLVRASNTTPVLVLRFDADTDVVLARIQDTFRKQLLALDANLKLPF
ncbi:MAG: phosphomannomutase/phosphoglucomutase [Proteobacteria bacterium]|nr:phosphomannomutase/phosphoglucomutase [Pseudomonadota bacterium]MCE7950363.1 phosphomannomutase/phosphoglucomutase [Xanthomonadales bacterium PRO7]